METIKKELLLSEEQLVAGDKEYDDPVEKLPDPKEGFSKGKLLGDIINQIRKGTPFYRITIPITFISPMSMLELMSRHFTPTDELTTIASSKTAEDRFLRVVRWSIKNLPRMISRKGFCHIKPCNPILGERYFWKWDTPNGEIKGQAVQVSHHPPISNFYISSRKNNFSIRSSIGTRSKLYPNSFGLHMVGEINLMIHSLGEEYELFFPPIFVYGILYGKQYSEFNEKYRISCKKTGYHYELEFKAKRNSKIKGKIYKNHPKNVVFRLSGNADDKVYIESKHEKEKKLFSDNSDPKFIKKKQMVASLIDQEENESRRNWFLVSKHLKKGDRNNAQKYKTLIEKRQRIYRKERKEKGIEYVPQDVTAIKEKVGEDLECSEVKFYRHKLENRTPYKEGEKDAFENLDVWEKIKC